MRRRQLFALHEIRVIDRYKRIGKRNSFKNFAANAQDPESRLAIPYIYVDSNVMVSK